MKENLTAEEAINKYKRLKSAWLKNNTHASYEQIIAQLKAFAEECGI